MLLTEDEHTTNEHTRYVCCRRISLSTTQLQSFKFGYSVFALLLVYNLILDPVTGTSVTATTGKETCEKHVKIFTCISHVKTCEIYDFICFEVSFTCFNILKNVEIEKCI